MLLNGLIAKLNDMKRSLASGQEVPQEKLDGAQKELDTFIAKE